MAIEDIYQHHFRLNLNNPYHLKLHRELIRINKDVYKSKNEYVIRKLYAGIFGSEDEIVQAEKVSPDKYITKQLEDRIVQRVTEKLLEKFMSKPEERVELQDVLSVGEEIDEELADAAIGYFDDWGDEDA